MNSPNSLALTGTQTGTTSLSLTWNSSLNGAAETISLTGQFSPDGSTISGTYTNSGFLAGCFLSGTSGTFSFTRYVYAATYSGTWAGGTVTLNGVVGSSLLTIGAIPNVCASATSVALGQPSGVTSGRFFYMFSDDSSVAVDGSTAPSRLALWGLTNDPAGQTIKIYAAFPFGPAPNESPCVEYFVNSLDFTNPRSSVTLTKQ
jgi:hypothetical protein